MTAPISQLRRGHIICGNELESSFGVPEEISASALGRLFLAVLFAGTELFVLGTGEKLLGREFKLAEYLAGGLGGGAAFLPWYAVIVGRDKQRNGTGQLYHRKQPESYVYPLDEHRLAAAGAFQLFAVYLCLEGDGSHHADGDLGLVDDAAAAVVPAVLMMSVIVAGEGLDIALCAVEYHPLVPYGAPRQRIAFLGAAVFVGVHFDIEGVGDIHRVIAAFEGHAVNGDAYAADIHTAGLDDVHGLGQAAAFVKAYGKLADAVPLGAGIEDTPGLDADGFLEKIGTFLWIAHIYSVLLRFADTYCAFLLKNSAVIYFIRNITD